MWRRLKPWSWVPLATLVVLSGACTTSRALRPVGAKQWQVGGSIGGPVFTNLGAPIPTPLLNVYGRYGLTEKATLEFGLSPTVIRALGADVGASYELLAQKGGIPRVMADGRVYLWAGLAELTGKPRGSGTPFTLAPRIYEQLQATAAWDVGRFTLYAGLNLFAQVERVIFVPSLIAGVEWRVGRLVGLQLELKQMGFTQNQLFAVVDFIGPGNFGAFAVQLGVNIYPGAK